MSRYAADTSVSVERSKAEIEKTLTRYGASAFAYGWEGDEAMIQFRAAKWWLGEYTRDPDPKLIGITWRKLLVVQ